MIRNIIGALIWGLRVTCIVIGAIALHNEYQYVDMLLWFAIAEMAATFFGAFRKEQDEIIPVITGFSAGGLDGYFEYNDNLAVRIFGFVFFIIALALRVILIVCLVDNLFNLSQLLIDFWTHPEEAASVIRAFV